MCPSFRLIFSIKCGLWKEHCSLKEGILFSEESGDEAGVLCQCGVGGDGAGVPDVPVPLHIAVAIACDTEIGWVSVVVGFVCMDVGLSDCVLFDVSVGTVLTCCFCLDCNIS